MALILRPHRARLSSGVPRISTRRRVNWCTNHAVSFPTDVQKIGSLASIVTCKPHMVCVVSLERSDLAHLSARMRMAAQLQVHLDAHRNTSTTVAQGWQACTRLQAIGP